jgi:prolipoprotein diacylglyceryltransferase
VFGGIAAAYPSLRRAGLPFKQLMDAAAPGFPLGLIFGRIGDLIIGDHLGGPTALPFGFRYEGGQLPGCPSLPGSGISCPALGEVVHQTALYDLASALVLLPVVLLLSRRRRFDGFLIMSTATWYAVVRYVSDYARSGPLYAGFRGTQWVSIVLGLFGVWYLVRGSRFGVVSPPLPPTHPAAATRTEPPAPPGTEPAAPPGPSESEDRSEF